MTFKILKNTILHKEISLLFQKVGDAAALAQLVVAGFGATEYIANILNLYTGIDGVYFSEPPKGWKRLPDDDKLYLPRPSNVEAYEKVKEVPVISFGALNEILDYNQQIIGLWTYVTPLVLATDEFILIQVNQALTFCAKKEMIAIEKKEFDLLQAAAYETSFKKIFIKLYNAQPEAA